MKLIKESLLVIVLAPLCILAALLCFAEDEPIKIVIVMGGLCFAGRFFFA